MRILLLTDMPPCTSYTAGLVLDQLCRFLPKGSIFCFAVVNPHLNSKVSADLDWIPTEYCTRPRENWWFGPRKLGGTWSLLAENTYSLLEIQKIVKKAVSFGKLHQVDAVWCILEGQTMIRLAVPVSKGLGVPLLTQVWDPPYWWLRENGVDSLTKSFILREFDKAITNSVACATASWAMAIEYKSNYGVRTQPLIPSLSINKALPPAAATHSNDEIIIGMAGQIYATKEWEALIQALNSVNWTILGRKVKIRILGRSANFHANCEVRFEFLGWSSQDETIKLMSETDILYCPYWFDETFMTESRLSFPSKLTTYLATGRPVLFHGPNYASPARFLEEHKSGYCCYSLEGTEILKAITKLIQDKYLYAQLATNGHVAFKKYLTLESMRKSFESFLGIGANFLVKNTRME